MRVIDFNRDDENIDVMEMDDFCLTWDGVRIVRIDKGSKLHRQEAEAEIKVFPWRYVDGHLTEQQSQIVAQYGPTTQEEWERMVCSLPAEIAEDLNNKGVSAILLEEWLKKGYIARANRTDSGSDLPPAMEYEECRLKYPPEVIQQLREEEVNNLSI